MYVYACGLNSNGQIMKPGPSIFCCPTKIIWAGTQVTYATITFTHIFWKIETGWKCTGFKSDNIPDETAIGVHKQVYGSDNRTVAMTPNGSVAIWQKGWRTLHFQDSLEEFDDDDMTRPHHTDTNEGFKVVGPNKLWHSNNKNAKEELQKPTKLMRIERDPMSMKEEETNKERSVLSFCQVAVEDNSLLALTTDGLVLSGGVAVPLRVKINEVAMGKEHCIARSQHGQVYTWGSGMHGQLGIGELCKSEKPLVVEILQGINITSIASGAWHCLALSDCGDVYVWGWNECGQLGFPQPSHKNHSIFEAFHHICKCSPSHACIQVQRKNDTRVNDDRSREVLNVQVSPKLLDFWAEDINVVNVECGDRHTLFLLDDGSAWAVGMNRYGQLGLGHTMVTEEPCEVITNVIKIFAGGWNSVFITDSTR